MTTTKNYVSGGPDCAVCGCKEINVAHDDPLWRKDPKTGHSWPHPSQDGLDYYTWANVEYHPFKAVHEHKWSCVCGATQ